MSGSRRRGADTCSVDSSQFMSLLYKCSSMSSNNAVEVMKYSPLQGIALKNETPFLMGCKDMLRISEETQTHFYNVDGTAAETTTVLVLHEKGLYRKSFIVQEDQTLDRIFADFRAGLQEWQVCTSGISFAFLHLPTCKPGSSTPQHPPMELLGSHVTVQDLPKTVYSSLHSNLMFHRAERVVIACDDDFLIHIRSPIRRYDVLLNPDPAFDFLRFAEFTYRASPFSPLEQVFADHCAIQEIDREKASFYLMTCDDRTLWPIVHGTETLHDLQVDRGFQLHVHVDDPSVHGLSIPDLVGSLVSTLPLLGRKPEIPPSRGLYWDEFARPGLDFCDFSDQFRERNRQMQGLDLHGCKKFLSNQDMIASNIVTNMTMRFFALQQAVTGTGDVDIYALSSGRDDAIVENAFFVHYWERHEHLFATWTERAVSLYLSARWDDFQAQKCAINDTVMALARKEAKIESKSRAVAELQNKNTKRHGELLKCLRTGQQRQEEISQKEKRYAAEAERFHKQVQELKKNQEKHMAAVDNFQSEHKKLETDKVEFRLKKMQLEERLLSLDILEEDFHRKIDSVEVQKESLGALLAKSEKQETEAKERVEGIKDYKKKLCSREAMVRQREAAVGDLEAAVEDREAAVGDLEAAVEDREAAVEYLEAAFDDREAAVGDLEAAVEDREAAVEDREAAVEDREKALKQREAAVGDLEAAVEDREKALKQREAAVGDLEVAVGDREKALKQGEAAVEKHREQFDDDLMSVQETKQQFQDMQNQLMDQGEKILALEGQLSHTEKRGMCDAATQMDTTTPCTSAVVEYVESIYDLLCLHSGRYAGKIAGMLREHLEELGLQSMNEDDLFVFVSQSVKVLSTFAKATRWSFNTNANDLLTKLQTVDVPEQDDICNFILSQLDPSQILMMAPGIDDLKMLVSEIRSSQQFADWLLCEEYLLFVRMAMEKQAEHVLTWQSSTHRQEAAKTACMAELQVYPTKTMIARKIHSWMELEFVRLDDMIAIESDFIARYVKNERLYKFPPKGIVDIFALRHPGESQQRDVGLIFEQRSSRGAVGGIKKTV